MADEHPVFEVQVEVRGPWRRYIDDLAPLRPELFRFCCGLTGNVWDGEDLLQDVLLRVFGNLGKINADLAHPRAYLVRTATNMWIDRIRRAKLERAYAEDPPEAPRQEHDASLVVDVRAAANSLFLHLAPQERAAVLLADVLDFSLEETASMLKTTSGAVKSALHRGRARLKAANAAPPATSTTPREIVDRFVAALTAKDFESIRALCLADVTIDMVGGAGFDGYEAGKVVVEHAHFVMPDWGFGDDPHWRVAVYEGEPIAIGFRTLGGVEGLNEIWRLEAGEGGVAKVRLYCFTPDVLAAVAKDLGLVALRRPYRSPP
jgi:RNA polymerase sigma-70 factor (ECF subfamily)